MTTIGLWRSVLEGMGKMIRRDYDDALADG
jgi:hypothetical protein